ncbi:MAG: hypothetical protein IPH80_00740 [Myxococcales bacterium]|nr:hypothetical protein [Myxococcales bacterium]
MRTLILLLVVVLGSVVGVGGATAQAPGPHPRLFLDAPTRAALQAQQKAKGAAVAAAIGVCRGIDKDDGNHTHAGYMGLEWARYLQACLVAWAATDDDGDARRAIKFHTALIDDLDRLGDRKGGDTAANRDSGFAIRALGVYTAISYDWLHDHPAMTPALRARTQQRWAAWTTWYLANGYRARSPSTNYHAGYLAAVTFIAIAQRGEAGAAGDALWSLVADELWGKDMAKAMAPGGVLDGGDWGEGWQYGPLSVVEYAAAARAMTGQGVEVEGVRAWLDALLARTIHAQTPGGGIFAGGDTQVESPNLPPNSNTYDAVLVGDASPSHQAWAASERAALPAGGDFPLWSALAQARGAKPTPPPRASWPTSYLASGTGAFFARSAWDKRAIWFASQCHSTIDVDHSHPNAGNFVLARGGDDVIVDPTPYGSLATLTSNAPTVVSAHLPPDYLPSQAWWSERTGYAWARQTASGIVATRCDYADQYKFQHRTSDVPMALRDVVVVPWGDHDATAIVIDRAASGDRARGLHLRFRTPGQLTAQGKAAVATVGKSQVRIQTLAASGGAPAAERQPAGSCFEDKWTRGNCAAARFTVDQWRLVVPGPTMTAIHAIDAVAKGAALPALTARTSGDVTVVSGPSFAVVVGGGDALSYAGPRAARHVVVDGPTADAVVVAASVDGDGCKVTVGASGDGTTIAGRPRVFAVDAACVVAVDAAAPAMAPDAGADAGPGPGGAVDGGSSGGGGDAANPGLAPPRSARSGCCGAEAAPGAPVSMTAVVLAVWFALGRRGKRERRRRCAR